MDRGAWWATVSGVANGWTDLSMSRSCHFQVSMRGGPVLSRGCSVFSCASAPAGGGPLPEGWAQRLCPALPSQGCRGQAGLPQQAALLAAEGCCPEGARGGPGSLGEAGSPSPSTGTGWWGRAGTRAGWGKWLREKQGPGPQSSRRQGKEAPYPAAWGPWDVEAAVTGRSLGGLGQVPPCVLPSSYEEVEWSVSLRWRGPALSPPPAGLQSWPPSPLQNASMSQRGTSWPQMAPKSAGRGSVCREVVSWFLILLFVHRWEHSVWLLETR